MNNNVRILQLIDSLEIGGSERMSVNMYNTFTSCNIDNHLVVSRKSGALYSFIKDKNNVTFLNKKGFFDVVAFLKLFKLIRNYQPSVIHAHQTSIYWAFFAKLLFPKKIIIWHDHWGFSDLLKDSDRRAIRKLSFLIDGVVCVNDKIKQWNINNLRVKEEHIKYIRNYPVFEKSAVKPTNVFTMVCLANIRDQKDHENLLKACALLNEEKLNFKLFLAGSLEDTSYVERIKKLIKTLKLNTKVEILGPVINISEILSNADVGVLSSMSEGLPLSLLEYGMAELPVVCTNVGQCSEVLGNGEFGWVVPPKSPKDLALAIKKVYKKPEEAHFKAMALKENILENYGAKGFVKVYFKLIDVIKN